MICTMFIKLLKNAIQENCKVLIAFDDMIADMHNNKKVNSIVTHFFIRCRKLNISLAFLKQSYFKVPKDVRLTTTHFFIMKTPNKRELEQTVYNHLSKIDFNDFMNLHQKCTAKLYYF